ncbi:SMC-Scp complex subunit ScpB [Terasakiispira papahanaumokuakeensis]|uniref:SMC-Scp complex subunit ScpB n=1 Tax=Terasakiispira papahanaumokuakeensis TaxID=197479 RepID=A0A1E2VAV3_9GAMM|nr:SMC-Scp complex subunit ScpB [Terasakiispira papahanaumokuakeensis]ODC04117.1 SMC-Scp complex subunit ScpB [Terasakiispira papahanaumokuakeensis]
MTPSGEHLEQIIEAVLLAAQRPMSVEQLFALFDEHEKPSRHDIKTALMQLSARLDASAQELVEVGSGWRLHIRSDYAAWVSRLWEEKPPRYSRALLETLALVAYRQPITRGEIEEVRGVSVSTQIIRTLEEREWIRVIGHRDVPGRPSLYATTRQFLDYFNLRTLDELPALAELPEPEAQEWEDELDRAAREQPPLSGHDEAAHDDKTEDGEATHSLSVEQERRRALGPSDDDPLLNIPMPEISSLTFAEISARFDPSSDLPESDSSDASDADDAQASDET